MRRAFWIFTGFVTISFLAISAALLYFGHDYTDRELEQKVSRDLRLMATISRGALAYADYESIEEEILLWGQSDPNIISFRASHDDGYLLAEFTRETQSIDILRLRHSFVSPQGRKVHLAIDYDMTEHRKHVLEFCLVFFVLTGIIAAIFISSLWMILQRLAIRPLHREITERNQVENTLQRSEALLNATQQLSKVGGWEWDVEKETMFWTDEVYRIHDFQPSEFTPGSTEHIERSIECYNPEDRPVIIEAFKNCAEKGKAYDLELPFTTSKGRRIWIRTVTNPVLKGDRVVKVVGNIMDITDRKQAVEALRIEKDNLSNIFQAMEDGVYIVNQQYVIQYANPVLIKEFGIYEGRKCYEYFHGRTDACLWCKNPDVFAGKTVRWEYNSLKNHRTYDLIDTPLNNSDGSISKLQIFRDITERKQTEEALLTSMEKFRCVSSSVPDAIVMIDNEGCISFFNKAAEKILGYTQGEVIGKSLHETLIPKQYHESSLKGLERFKKTGEGPAIGKTLELIGKRKDGSEFPIELGVSAVELDKKWHAVGIIRDITERKQAEGAIKERLQFETLMAELSATFVNLPLNKFNSEIERWLQRIAEFCGADHCSLWQWSHDDRNHIPVHAWTAPESDFTPKPHGGKERCWCENILLRGEEIVFRTKEDLPPEASGDCVSLTIDGARSVITVPVKERQTHWGALTVSVPERESNWPEGLALRLRLAADIFANALLHKRSEEELKGAFSEIKTLKEQIEAENIYLREEIKTTHLHGDFVSQSKAMKTVLAQAEQVAQTDSTVLIQGETGTGKEVLARAIHTMSKLADAPLLTVNCAAIPSSLVESELFGHEKGAFTGAATRAVGRFEAANGGTIFLDEIGELPASAQAKILRVLQFGQFERLGSSKTTTVKVRVIAATNRDLQESVGKGEFREDLFYRINVFPISLPALRDRPEDIPELVWIFVDEFNLKMGKQIKSVSKRSMEILKAYRWPGNIRELRNIIERAMIRSSEDTLRVDLPKLPVTISEGGRSLKLVEKRHIAETLELTNWRIRGKGGAAEILGVKATTLEARMKKLGINRPA